MKKKIRKFYITYIYSNVELMIVSSIIMFFFVMPFTLVGSLIFFLSPVNPETYEVTAIVTQINEFEDNKYHMGFKYEDTARVIDISAEEYVSYQVGDEVTIKVTEGKSRTGHYTKTHELGGN